jgi:hypothetical protein
MVGGEPHHKLFSRAIPSASRVQCFDWCGVDAARDYSEDGGCSRFDSEDALISNAFMVRRRGARRVALLLFSAACASSLLSQSAPRPAAPSTANPGQTDSSKNAAPAVAAGSNIAPPAPTYAYPDGQTFTYSVEWRLLKAGTAILRLDTVNGERHIVATADSTGAVALLYHVHDRLETFFNPQTNCALALTKHTEEGFRRVETRIRYDSSRKKTVLDERNLRANNEKHEENDIPSCVTNTLAAAYYVASQPLQQGSTFLFPSSDGGKSADISVTVEGREAVKTAAGKYDTIRIAAEAVSGPQKGKGKIWVWYSDEPRRIPVQMRVRAFWGTLTFELTQLGPTAAERPGR